MRKYIYIAVLVLFAWLSISFPRSSLAEEGSVSITPLAANLHWPQEPETPAPTAGQPVLDAMRHVRELLQREVDNQNMQPGYRQPIVDSRNVPMEIIVALWNEDANEYDLVRVLKNGTKLEQIGARSYQFRLVRDNGVNSLIEVTNRPDLMVLGLIHPVFTDVSTSTRTRYRLDNVVYIPYSERLNVTAVVQAGEEYLNDKIKAVYDELDHLGIRSMSFRNSKITEVIAPSIVKTILAIEHVDASVLLNNSADSYIKRFYTTLAGNEQSSYAYAKSSASARGLVQFIPSTYASLRKLRPELTLHADFVQGMTDPYNAIKAQIALLDYNLTLLPEETRQKYLDDDFELGSYLAAMYNGGPSRVRRAIASWGDEWAKYHGNIATGLRQETAYYVAKFRLVFGHFSDDSMHLAVNGS